VLGINYAFQVTMTLQQIANEITSKGFVFQVSIPNNPDYRAGKVTTAQALANAASVESYMERIARINQASNILVKLFTPNGSSYKQRGEHLIFFPKPEAVATPATTATDVVASATKNATMPTAPATMGSLADTPKPTNNMDLEKMIDYRVLQVEKSTLSARNEELKTEVKQLQRKVDELYEENKALSKENSVATEKHSLALERQKLESEREAKSGLSGLMDDVGKNPEMLKMLLGVLKPDHPMFKMEAAEAGKQLNGTAPEYHKENEANIIITEICKVLGTMNGNDIGNMYLLFLEISKRPEVVQQVYDYTKTINQN